MSDFENTSGVRKDGDTDRKAQNQGQRFTPLRSYVTRAKALTREARDEMALSRLIPVARLQS